MRIKIFHESQYFFSLKIKIFSFHDGRDRPVNIIAVIPTSRKRRVHANIARINLLYCILML